MNDSDELRILVVALLASLVIGAGALLDSWSRLNVELTVEEIAAADHCVRNHLTQMTSVEAKRDRSSISGLTTSEPEGMDPRPLLRRDMTAAVRACEAIRTVTDQQGALSATAEQQQ
jgi:hypothetical protein